MRETAGRGVTLPEFLTARARRASDLRLALDAGGGVLVAALVAITRPPAWRSLLALGACFAAFGLWGILDRELGDPPGASRTRQRWLRGSRALVTVLGVAAAAFFGLSVFFGALGRWIS
jgi:hypothetical protein